MHPILFHIGPVPVRAYGVAVLLGFLLGLAYAMAAARRQLLRKPPPGCERLTPEHVFDFAMVALVVAVIGARALYVAMDWHEFRDNPLDALRVWTGGLSIYGSIAASLAYMAWFCRRRRLDFLTLADIGAPSFALGYAIGRVGCFLNGCCYGAECHLPWAVRFAAEGDPGHLTPPSHPTQLYAAAINLVWFILLDRWSRRSQRRGEILIGYLLLYSVYRFVVEQFRKGATATLFAYGLTHAQAFSLAAIPVLLFLLLKLRRTPRPALGEEPPRD